MVGRGGSVLGVSVRIEGTDWSHLHRAHCRKSIGSQPKLTFSAKLSRGGPQRCLTSAGVLSYATRPYTPLSAQNAHITGV